MIKILDFTSLIFYCLFIYWLSDQPSLPVPALFPVQDKILHAGAYFIMEVFAWRCFKHQFNQPITLALTSAVFCSLYGMSDEWHQSFVIGRSSEIADWLADTSGTGFAAFLLAHDVKLGYLEKLRNIRK